jgi:hypothetical protein
LGFPTGCNLYAIIRHYVANYPVHLGHDPRRNLLFLYPYQQQMDHVHHDPNVLLSLHQKPALSM